MTAENNKFGKLTCNWADEVVEFENSDNSGRTCQNTSSQIEGDTDSEKCQQQNNNDKLKPLKRRYSYTSSTRSNNSRPPSCNSFSSDDGSISYIERSKEKRTRRLSNSSTSSVESDPIILARRQKQIDYGKNTTAYDNYLDKVPRSKRNRQHPQTPDKYRKYSRRAFDGLIKIWRKQLHLYDLPNIQQSSVASDTDSD